MANQLGLTDDMYLSDDQRGLAADLSRAYDNSREIQERSMARYGLPAIANFDKDWAIARARTMADRTNRMRMARDVGGSAQPGRSLQDKLGGVTQLASLLFGRDAFGKVMDNGIINTVKDVWGNIVSAPGEGYQDWLSKNSFTTAEGNTAIVGQDGLLRVVDPGSGALLETINNGEWGYNGAGSVDFNSGLFGGASDTNGGATNEYGWDGGWDMLGGDSSGDYSWGGDSTGGDSWLYGE